jgi:hypothetical protein
MQRVALALRERETPISVSCLSLLPALFSSLEHLQREQEEEEEKFE